MLTPSPTYRSGRLSVAMLAEPLSTAGKPDVTTGSHDLLLLARQLAAFLAQLTRHALPIQLRLERDGPPVLRVGDDAEIYLAPPAGGYVFALTRRSAAPVVLELGDKGDLFDVVAAHLVAPDEMPLRPVGAVARTLVGSTVAEVERAVILATLTQYGGNRSRAAVVLGISLRTMRNKLRLYKDVPDDTGYRAAGPTEGRW